MNLISRSELETLMQRRGEKCVSVYMPTHREGAEIQQGPIRLKNLLGEARERLLASEFASPEVEALLAPAQELIPRHDFWRHQSGGLALFVAPDLMRAYRLPFDFDELLVVADRFHVKPLLPLLSGDGRFYVLALSQDDIRLLQGTRYSVGQVDLESVPESLAEVLKWDDPERRLQWHSRTSPRPDGRAAIFHGHGVASEDDPKEYILRYFQRIDKGVSRLLAGDTAPLVLAGVDYLHPLYQEANSYAHLIEKGIQGNPEALSAEVLHEQAWAIVQPRFQKAREEAAARYQQLAGSGSERTSSELEEVVPAAYHARVDLLFVSLEQQRWGNFDPESNAVDLHQEAAPGDEDLLDLAAVHTFLNGGAVYAVESSEMPGDASLAAVFRY